MDIQKYLFIVKGEDKTANILSYKLDKNYIHINYKDSEKPYTYIKRDFEFYKDPIEIDIKKYKFILEQGYIYNVKRAIKFTNYYRLFFEDDASTVVSENDLLLLKEDNIETISVNKFEYFKDISRITSVKTEEGKALLTEEYEKINFIAKDTALYKYLNTKEKLNNMNTKIDKVIFPFGANKSQVEAVKNAMKSQISIIEGPPGTGKTQTILNIIANIVKNGQTVAVVSNNNAATDNVYEKLEKYNLSYLCARLGKKENKDEFINNQTGVYPEFKQKIENREELENEIVLLNQNISRIFDIQNEMAKLKEELSEIKVEHEYLKKYEGNKLKDNIKIRNIKRVKPSIIMKLKVECEELEKIDFWFKLKSQIIYGIGNKEFYRKSKDEIVKYYNKLFFILKEMELENEIKSRQMELTELGTDKLDLLTTKSMNLLHEYLREKYKSKTDREIFETTDLYKKSGKFNNEYPIVFSTTYSIKNSLNDNYKYDYIIMDESSQVDLITGVLALSVAKNAVIVGDLKQLPNVITTDDKNAIKELSKKYKIEEKYDYLKHSFLSSINEVLTDAPRILLKEHYRCHPKIVQFCNKKFYNNELIVMTEDKGEDDILKVYITNTGNHARGHINQRQIDVIEKEIIPELSEKVDEDNMGIISPYRNQKELMKDTFDGNLKIDTVHKFQGREQDAIIITTVDNEIGDFVDDPKMLNVAVTRAKKYLRLVVSNNENNKNTNIGDLIRYIQYNNFETVESKTKSIYDLLYKENREKRMEYLKNKKRISDYDSENITYNLIDEILKENNYDNLDIAVHVPLTNILENLNLLDEAEIKYATNVWTHIDFVIFNKMDKKLVIAIEVDGYYYHREGTKQQQNDKLKDRILEKYDIPLIRLSTIGSGEKEKLESKIKEIFAK